MTTISYFKIRKEKLYVLGADCKFVIMAFHRGTTMSMKSDYSTATQLPR